MDMVRAVYLCVEMRFPNVVTLEPISSPDPVRGNQTFRKLPTMQIRFKGESPKLFELGSEYYLDITRVE
jgi:hypothetical protein